MVDYEPQKLAITDPEIAMGAPVNDALQPMSEEIEPKPSGFLYCINKNCKVNFFDPALATKQTKRSVRCNSCKTLICKKCNAAGHGMERCLY